MLSDTVKKLLEGFPVIVTEPVRWGDMDAMGHVNNTVYFRYFEDVRIPFMRRLDFFDNGANGVGPILAGTDCRFKLPLTYPDTIHLGCKIEKLSADRMMFLVRIVSEQHQRIAAEGHSDIVIYDYDNAKKVPMPAGLRERILALQPELASEIV